MSADTFAEYAGRKLRTLRFEVREATELEAKEDDPRRYALRVVESDGAGSSHAALHKVTEADLWELWRTVGRVLVGDPLPVDSGAP